MDLAATLGSRLLVVYDGHCGLCNRTVRWLLARDRHDRLRFAPSHSPAVAALLARHGFTPDASPNGPSSSGPGTILVFRAAATPAEQLFTRSTAVAVVLAELPRPWPFAARLLRLVPRPLRDLAYRLIARWRYRIWGRLSACPLPAPGEQSRFFL
ncbi:MAG: DCC1-like thiol-disulfide oxidoreductase family protein [Terracidiphilus sp.]